MTLLFLLLFLLPQDRPEVVKPEPNRALDANKLYAEGVLQAKRGLYLDAVKSFEAALKLDPDALPPRRMLAQHYATVGRPDEALAMAKLVTERAPDDYTAWQLYAARLKEFGRAKDAIAALTKATELDGAAKSPDQLALMLNRLATWARDAGDHAGAAGALRRYLAILANNRVRFRESEFLDDSAFADETASARERLGEALLKLDKPEDALREFDAARAIFKDRNDTKAKLWAHRLQWHLARVHAAQKDYTAAKEHLQEYLKHVTPGNLEPYRLLSEVLLQIDRPSAGARLLVYADADEKNLPLQMLLADTYSRANNTSAAEDIYRKLAKKEPRPEVYRAMFQLYERIGYVRDALRRIDEQGDILEQPDLGEEAKKKAEAQMRAIDVALLKQPSLILKLLPLADQESRNRLGRQRINYGTFSHLAWLIANTDKLEDAERYFREIAPRDRGHFFSYRYELALLSILSRRHKYSDVKSICRYRLQNIDDLPNANLNEYRYNSYLEDALMHLGEIDEALRNNEQTLLQAPNEAARVSTRLSRVAMLRNADRPTEALAECEKILKEFPQPKYSRGVRLTMATLLTHSGKPAAGEKLLRRLLDDDPNDVRVLNSLGYELAEQSRNLDEAEKFVRRALELDKRARKFGEGDDEEEPPAADDDDRADYLDSLAWVLFRKGKPVAAREILEKAVSQRDGREQATLWDHLGDIHYKLGELGKAREAWGKAKEFYAREPISKKDGRLDEVSRKLSVLK